MAKPPADNLSYVMSGAIMIIIPGLAIGTSIRDIMSNDILSGSVRLFQAVASSMAIAAGFSAFAQLYQGEVLMNNVAEWWVVLLTTLICTLGFAILFNNKYKQLIIVSLCGLISTTAYLFSEIYFDSTFVGVMLGSMVATILAEILARILRSPTTVFLMPAIIPFVPGASLFFMMYNLINGNDSGFKQYLSVLLQASLGIAVGIILASVAAQIIIKAIKKIKMKV